MVLQQIENRCNAKANELINKHFSNLAKENTVERPEEIGEYTLDLPHKIEAEYYAYLKSIWSEIVLEGSPSFEENIDKKGLSDTMTIDDRKTLLSAYEEAMRRTIWERLTKTNHKDVAYYKSLLKRYTKDLLLALRYDFMEEVEKIISDDNNEKTYTPKPIDTSDIELPAELQQLVEQLAHNVHENWALGRLNDGWTYGLERDDTLKKHPCLVEYDDLPDSEKAYDRHTAIETLKLILKLGWIITLPSSRSDQPTT